MERITVKYYRADTPYLSPEAIEEIIQSRGTIKNACKEMMEKISGGGMNNIPNTDIVAQIEREIKRKDKNLANTARIMSTT
ncbi:4646_t:CDS:2 [Entrophospora sp. SA101]|nr:4646_t:CDS:2 [Entrophospora sp. SA101]